MRQNEKMYEEVLVKVHRSVLRLNYGNGQIYIDSVNEMPSMSGGHSATVGWGVPDGK